VARYAGRGPALSHCVGEGRYQTLARASKRVRANARGEVVGRGGTSHQDANQLERVGEPFGDLEKQLFAAPGAPKTGMRTFTSDAWSVRASDSQYRLGEAIGSRSPLGSR